MKRLAFTAGLCLVLGAQVRTGPDVGQTLPSFQAPDQNGRMRTLADVAGPKGALVVVYRSADW